jgi:uncharacterized membrane protein
MNDDIVIDAPLPRERDYTPLVALGVLIAVYVFVFGRLTWRQQSNFGTFGYDMGIHDQAIWLASRFQAPFVTIRGLNYFGHHVDVISLLFAPIYWLGGGPHALYFVETVALAAGAIPVWLLTRDKLDPWIALVPAGAYLLQPAIEWTNWWHFHPDALAVTPLLFAWWFATRRRWRWFAVCIALGLATKEDASMAVFVMGAMLFFRGEKVVGRWTAFAGFAWFLVCTKLVIPLVNHGGTPFYEDFFPGLGTSLQEILFNMVRHPSRVLGPMTQADRLTYWRKLLFPIGLLALLSPLVLIAGPQALVNGLASHSPSHDIRFHYSSLIEVGLMLAMVDAFVRIARRGDAARIFVVVVLSVAAVAANREWSPSPIGRDYRTGIWAHATPHGTIFDKAVHMAKGSDGVAATYLLVPHLTHRKYIYEFPNPWHIVNWDPSFRNAPPKLNTVNLLVLDRGLLGDTTDLFDQLTSPRGSFRIVFDQDNVVVARRTHRPDKFERDLRAASLADYLSHH